MSNMIWGEGWPMAENAEAQRRASYLRALASLPEDQRGENPVQTFADTTFYPKEDVLDTLPDGRCIAVYRANMPMPIAEARRRGLVADVEGGA